MTGIPESDDFFEKAPSILEQKAYRDTWGNGVASYVRWFYEAVVWLRELLTEEGSIYVHLDFNVGHYAKAVLDEELGATGFRNEIVWRRTSAHANVSQRYGNVHDVLLYYTKSEKFKWNQQYSPYDPEYLNTFFDQLDDKGRRYARRDLTAGMDRASKSQIYTWKGIIRLQGNFKLQLSTSVPYHLRENWKMPQKSPNVFYHLQTSIPVTTSVIYHLRKKVGGRGCSG